MPISQQRLMIQAPTRQLNYQVMSFLTVQTSYPFNGVLLIVMIFLWLGTWNMDLIGKWTTMTTNKWKEAWGKEWSDQESYCKFGQPVRTSRNWQLPRDIILCSEGRLRSMSTLWKDLEVYFPMDRLNSDWDYAFFSVCACLLTLPG